MNDFTKDELSFIFNLLINAHKGGIMTEYNNVLIKLKSMIDNYDYEECKHKWIKCFYGEEGTPINLCSICNFRERR